MHIFYYCSCISCGHAVAWMVEALCYNPEDRNLEVPMRALSVFNLPNPTSRTMALWLTQPPTETSTRNLPGGGGVTAGRRVRLKGLPPSVSRLSSKCGILDASRHYGSLRPIIGIALCFFSFYKSIYFKLG
jgi:hypothetical protein